ncbi:MAG: hypothetical protein ACO3C1_07815 [Ilumatobacteraceae bacterium]
MIICWSAKGGSGTTVVACALALVLGRHRPTLLVDLAGDAPAALGLTEPTGPGVSDWTTSAMGDVEAIGRLSTHVTGSVHLAPRGSGPVPAARIAHLYDALAALDGEVIVDGGTDMPSPDLGASVTSLLVVRPCYLALRRAVTAGVTPTGVVVVHEPGRALTSKDIARAIGAPVVADVPFDPAIARAVDAGLLATRLPRSLEQGVEAFA